MTMGARSIGMFGGGRPGEAQAQQRSALAALDTLAARYRSAVERAVEGGAGLDAAHAAGRPITEEAYDLLRRSGMTGLLAVEAWAAAQERARI